MTKKIKSFILFILIVVSLILVLSNRFWTLSALDPAQAGANKQAEAEKNGGATAMNGLPEEEQENITGGKDQDNRVGSPGDELPVTPPEDPDAGGSGGELWDETLARQLSFLQSPIPGANISSRDSQLPGAPRAYRHGTHEGLDFYGGACGVPVDFGDPVYAAGAGAILRIDHDFNELLTAYREELLERCAAGGDTPAEILDKLRGRQVWIIHDHDVITRYAHLSAVEENLQAGDQVEAGALIGRVGNSGTSNGALGTNDDAHLHLEIWVGSRYLGEGLSPEAVRVLWQQVLLE